jgi:hypothetical protein
MERWSSTFQKTTLRFATRSSLIAFKCTSVSYACYTLVVCQRGEGVAEIIWGVQIWTTMVQ